MKLNWDRLGTEVKLSLYFAVQLKVKNIVYANLFFNHSIFMDFTGHWTG